LLGGGANEIEVNSGNLLLVWRDMQMVWKRDGGGIKIKVLLGGGANEIEVNSGNMLLVWFGREMVEV
jgi:hypothetical protein